MKKGLKRFKAELMSMATIDDCSTSLMKKGLKLCPPLPYFIDVCNLLQHLPDEEGIET
mgnify:CR=1 FL=1